MGERRKCYVTVQKSRLNQFKTFKLRSAESSRDVRLNTSRYVTAHGAMRTKFVIDYTLFTQKKVRRVPTTTDLEGRVSGTFD